MNFYWYWPFARPEELDWASHTAGPGEHVTVHVVDRDVAPRVDEAPPRVTLVRDLPDVDRTARGLWMPLSRARTYVGRVRARQTAWSASGFDLVHVHYVNRFTDAVAPFTHPLVVSVHDVYPHQPRLGPRVERHLLSRVYGRADLLVVHHRSLAQRLADEFHIGGERVAVVPHQVFPVSGGPAPRPAGDPSVLFFGALRANKGLEVLAEAAPILAKAGVAVTVAGRGDPRLEAFALEMQRTFSNVQVELGFATPRRKAHLFRQATVVALPYVSFESQSGVLHDAYGHGRPVVVTDVGALGDTVREDNTGRVVAPRDPRHLAEGIVGLLDPVAWSAASEAGLRVATERSPQATGALLRLAYEPLLHR